jgi:hypothetical protein
MGQKVMYFLYYLIIPDFIRSFQKRLVKTLLKIFEKQDRNIHHFSNQTPPVTCFVTVCRKTPLIPLIAKPQDTHQRSQ